MKLHDLQPAPGSRTPRTRVGRGIAAGKGKTAGRGTKGQKARAGSSIPPWFEGGQTPLHQRIPKLRGFKNRFKIHYEVVNIGAIGDLAERGAFEVQASGKGAKDAPVTINQDILRAVGLVRTLDKPLKVLGAGELTKPLFVVADAFTASARAKIEAAGGTVNVLEVPTSPLAALGVTSDVDGPTESKAKPSRKASAKAETTTQATAAAESDDEPEATAATDTDTDTEAPAEKPSRKSAAKPAAESDDAPAGASDTAVEASDDAEPAGDDA